MARPPVSEFMTPDDLRAVNEYKDPLHRPERSVFIEIATSPGIYPKDVAERTNLNPDMVSKAVRKLLGFGWVFERKDPKDRRYTQLGMTEAGYDALLEWASHRTGTTVKKLSDVTVWTGEEPNT